MGRAKDKVDTEVSVTQVAPGYVSNKVIAVWLPEVPCEFLGAHERRVANNGAEAIPLNHHLGKLQWPVERPLAIEGLLGLSAEGCQIAVVEVGGDLERRVPPRSLLT